MKTKICILICFIFLSSCNNENKAVTPREYIVKSKEILTELEQFHPIFKNLFGWGSEANLRQGFKEDKSDFEEIVFKQILDKQIVYFNENTDDK